MFYNVVQLRTALVVTPVWVPHTLACSPNRTRHNRAPMLNAVKCSNDSDSPMATLTVRNLNEDLVRRLRIRAAEHGRSAEAEHREILRSVLSDTARPPMRQYAAERLAAFRRRVAGRGSSSAAELLAESRASRLQSLTGAED